MINKYTKVKNAVALWVVEHVATMECAVLFTCLACVSLPASLSAGIATTINWISTNFLQLVLLSVIMVGQDVQSKKSEKRASADHKMITEELKLLKEILSDLKKEP